MNQKITQNCEACGGSRIVSGRFAEGEPLFQFSDSKWGHWFTYSNIPTAVGIRTDALRMCLDCGKVTASLRVDLNEAKRVIEKWGSDALKAQFRSGAQSQ